MSTIGRGNGDGEFGSGARKDAVEVPEAVDVAEVEDVPEAVAADEAVAVDESVAVDEVMVVADDVELLVPVAVVL